MKKTQIRWWMLLLGGVGFLLVGAGIAQAAPIAVTNASFEDPVIVDPAYQPVPPTAGYGWNLSKPGDGGDLYIALAGGSVLGSYFPPGGAQDGANALFVGSDKTGNTQGYQSVGTVEAGKTYTVSLYVAGLNNLTVGKYGVYLHDGTAGSILGGVTNITAWQVWMDTGAAATAGVWSQISFSVLVPSEQDGHAVSLFLAVDSAASAEYIAFDNVTIDVIPEPATLGLLVIGGGFALWRKRR